LFGRRRVFLIGVGIFAIASAACGLASSVLQLIIARSVQGVEQRCWVPGSLAIIGASFDEKSRGKAIGTCPVSQRSPLPSDPLLADG